MATGETLPEDALVRFGLAPDGTVVADVAARLPGRGVWVTATRQAVETAARRGGFARGFKAKAEASLDLPAQVEAALIRRCLDQLGLARRAGALALGHTAVEAALRGGEAHLLIEAADAADDGRDKILRLAAAVAPSARLAGCFTAAELGMALGRDRVVHACMLHERMARRLAVDLDRLAGFRVIVPDSWPHASRFGISQRSAAVAAGDPASTEDTGPDG